ncbi:MAG: Xaa-Pro peptidase family protein [Acidimicrobiia bacterium]|nr:Xaa-Pro peptidase family protein [Acidimicrobiia bacterium]
MLSSEFLDRLASASAAVAASDYDALVVGVGPDLEYLTGYSAHELERLNVLVLTADREPTMVMPRLEAPGFPQIDGIRVRDWLDGEDALEILFDLVGDAKRVAVADTMRALFVVPMLRRRPGLEFGLSSEILGPLRMVKSEHERRLLAQSGACADQVTSDLMQGRVPLVGRTEREVAADIRRRLVAAGLDTAEFAIVGSGPNSASPHHEPTDRVIEQGEVVLFDIGGRLDGYHSDTTRCVHTGPVPAEIAEAWEVLAAAHAAAVDAATTDNTCQAVDRAARKVLEDAGYGDQFIHRTGHGIGLQGHEDPYIVEGNELRLEPGHAFSIEPGIYFARRWGLRLEDIVVVDDDGLIRCNQAPRTLNPV